jgi:hypothetical protein
MTFLDSKSLLGFVETEKILLTNNSREQKLKLYCCKSKSLEGFIVAKAKAWRALLLQVSTRKSISLAGFIVAKAKAWRAYCCKNKS